MQCHIIMMPSTVDSSGTPFLTRCLLSIAHYPFQGHGPDGAEAYLECENGRRDVYVSDVHVQNSSSVIIIILFFIFKMGGGRRKVP